MSLIRVTQFLKRIVGGNKLIIGRWNPILDDAKKEERALRSTYDHCGYSICGKPDEVKRGASTTCAKDANAVAPQPAPPVHSYGTFVRHNQGMKRADRRAALQRFLDSTRDAHTKLKD